MLYTITPSLFAIVEDAASLPPTSSSSSTTLGHNTPEATSIIGFAAVLTILVVAMVAVLLLCICYGFCKFHSRPAMERATVARPTPSSRRNSIPLPSPRTPKLQSGANYQRTPTHSTSFLLHSARPFNITTKSSSFNNSPITIEGGCFPSSSSAPRLHPPDIAVLTLAQTPCREAYSDHGNWQYTNNHVTHYYKFLPPCMEGGEPAKAKAIQEAQTDSQLQSPATASSPPCCQIPVSGDERRPPTTLGSEHCLKLHSSI